MSAMEMWQRATPLWSNWEAHCREAALSSSRLPLLGTHGAAGAAGKGSTASSWPLPAATMQVHATVLPHSSAAVPSPTRLTGYRGSMRGSWSASSSGCRDIPGGCPAGWTFPPPTPPKGDNNLRTGEQPSLAARSPPPSCSLFLPCCPSLPHLGNPPGARGTQTTKAESTHSPPSSREMQRRLGGPLAEHLRHHESAGCRVSLWDCHKPPYGRTTKPCCSSLLETWAGGIPGIPAPHVQFAKSSTGKKKKGEGRKEIQVTSQTLLLFKPASLPPLPGDAQNMIPACCEARAAS